VEFVKLYEQILRSTIWQEPCETRCVWITLLLLADKDGEVQTTVPGLAHFACVPLEACENALRALQAPDPYSGSPNNDGKRLEAISGGFRVLNYRQFFDRQTKTQEAEAARKRKRRQNA
jgi:hypothetical protein